MRLSGLSLVLFGVLTVSASEPDRASSDFFETKVRPVLVEHCYACHSSQARKLKGGLLLDTIEGMRKGGQSGPAVVPGKPEESLLVQAVHYDGELTRMPPKEKLPAPAIAALEEWIKVGTTGPSARPGTALPAAIGAKSRGVDLATARKHWAYQPIKRHDSPPVKNRSWPRMPIDGFVLARMEASGLTPSPPADRRTLLRRTYYDLIGLPPAAEEIDAFERDRSDDAFARVVDRLLASLRRALGPALARRRSLRRHQGRSVDVRRRPRSPLCLHLS
ncbi:MAG TPA: DUF1549 domain-containing protein, partial [Isosphaeraceae bacterium]|nr:DUF1549 domain-containing protein [Isosphaeraceae bacterium]